MNVRMYLCTLCGKLATYDLEGSGKSYVCAFSQDGGNGRKVSNLEGEERGGGEERQSCFHSKSDLLR